MLNWFQHLPDRIENFSVFIGFIVATIVAAYLTGRIFNRFIRRSTYLLHNDPTNYKFLSHALRALIYVVGFSFAINEIHPLQHLANSLLTGAGILAIAVGFASQHALSNLISGIFIVIFKPYRVNDRLSIQQKYSGIVEDITLRHTVIRDAENKRIIIPNSVMNTEILVNADFGDANVCRIINVNVSYEADIDQARALIRGLVQTHPYYIDPRSEADRQAGKDPVPVKVVALGDYAVTLRAEAWATDNTHAGEMYTDLLESIKKSFEKEGIKIPYQHMTIVQ